MNWPNINTMHQRFIYAQKELKINLFAVCNTFTPLCAGLLYLSHCFTTSVAVGMVGLQHILVAVIFNRLLRELYWKTAGRKMICKTVSMETFAFFLALSSFLQKAKVSGHFPNILPCSEGPIFFPEDERGCKYIQPLPPEMMILGSITDR